MRSNRGLGWIVAVVVAVVGLFPMGARAAGNLVTIVSSSDEAVEVSSGHLLVTNSAKLPLFVTAQDPLPVTGDVDARLEPARLHVQGHLMFGSDGGGPASAFGTNRHFSFADKVAITSITFHSDANITHAELYAFALGGARNCDRVTFLHHVDPVLILSHLRAGTTHLPFPEPLMASTPTPGRRGPWCVDWRLIGGHFPSVLTIGYVVTSG